MGIPSFYRHLCRRFPALIANGAPKNSEWLCLDFNCAMYHVLRNQPPYSGGLRDVWETNFCKDIAAYMAEIVNLVGPTKGVYVSCDGAVCAAKRRQQRLRRFKGPWTAAEEAKILKKEQGKEQEKEQVKESDEGESWDQNALTPGSAFMGKLGSSLSAAGAALEATIGVPVIVSTTAEHGEGEHKLMAHMRSIKPTSCTIYGLDADLILLSMLLNPIKVHLLREAQEFEATANGWKTLDIASLTSIMIPNVSPERIRDFVAAATLLGNDFLPRSLTRTVRDDGMPNLIADLKRHVWPHGYLVGADGKIGRTPLLALLKAWAATEERDLVVAAQNAIKASRRHPGDGALRYWNAQPARQASAAALLETKNHAVVYQGWHPGHPLNYLEGLAWTWDYYSGRVVDQSWQFTEHLPPLWSDLVTCLELDPAIKDLATVEPPTVVYPTPLPDWLHLLAVLPAASVARLLPASTQRFMAKAPYYWPTRWSLFDVGKTQIWECEPNLPIIPESVLRSWIRI